VSVGEFGIESGRRKPAAGCLNREAELSAFCSRVATSFSQQQQLRRLGKVTLATKPIFHRGFKLGQWDARPNFHQAISNRQRLIKNARIGEVAHAETVQPFQWAGMVPAVFYVLHADLAGEHHLQFPVSGLQLQDSTAGNRFDSGFQGTIS